MTGQMLNIDGDGRLPGVTHACRSDELSIIPTQRGFCPDPILRTRLECLLPE
jgi:hypothetical protein